MSEPSGKVKVTFLPAKLSTRVPPGTTAFNAAAWLGLPIESTCGGRGTCGKCKVRVEGDAVPITAADQHYLNAEELAAGWRLSCELEVLRDVVIHIPRLMAVHKTAMVGVGRPVRLEPDVQKVFLRLPQPALDDQRADYERLAAVLTELGYAVRGDLRAWRSLPAILRQADFAVTAVLVGDHLAAVEPGDTTATCYGLAFDIGTTTVVGNLADLHQGVVVGVASDLNGQAIYGADVISRIGYATKQPGGLEELQARVVATINGIIDRLLSETGVALEHIYEMTVVGNTTMLHLFLGLDPGAIARAPFIPVIRGPASVPAADLGVHMHPHGLVYVFPVIGAYVGGDTVAVLLASELLTRAHAATPKRSLEGRKIVHARHKPQGVRLAIDVGTNGEIALGSAERTLATAAAAGPAFEGAEISCGMRAAAGAIEGVRLNGDVHLQVIGDVPPIGVCGSGLIDVAAELLRVGLLEPSGRLLSRPEAEARGLPPGLCRRLRQNGQVQEFVLAWAEESGEGRDIALTQKDIRALQYAKGAIASGITILKQLLGVEDEDIEEVLLAGAFGSYINPASARAIGLVPPLPLERIKAIGNAAGEGAKIALLSFRERQVAEAIPTRVEYVELSGRADFNQVFMEALSFPERR